MAISTDPSVLAAASRCFDTCIPPGDQAAVKTYLLGQIAGVTDPAAVMTGARCFSSCISPGALPAVQAYQSAVLAGGSTDPSTLLNAARCFLSCIPPGANAAVTNYALANKAGGSTDPATLANAARCFSSCIPPGMQMAAQSYLMAVASGGSTDPAVIIGNASGFIGTSPDGGSTGITDTGLVTWAGGTGPTPPPPPTPLTTDWVARVLANGGAQPSASTITALKTFEGSISTLSSRIYHLNMIAPDSFIAMRTPFIKTFGFDPWVRHNVGTGGPGESLTVEGFDPSSGGSAIDCQIYDTGVVPSAIPAFTTANGGASFWVKPTISGTIANRVTNSGLGGYDGTRALLMMPDNISYQAYIWDSVNIVNPGFVIDQLGGFFMMARTATNALKMYTGRQALAWQQIGATQAFNNVTTPLTTTCYAAGDLYPAAVLHGSGDVRWSFFAFHDGFTSAEGQTLFNAVLALRVAFGGGFN